MPSQSGRFSELTFCNWKRGIWVGEGERKGIVFWRECVTVDVKTWNWILECASPFSITSVCVRGLLDLTIVIKTFIIWLIKKSFDRKYKKLFKKLVEFFLSSHWIQNHNCTCCFLDLGCGFRFDLNQISLL